MKKGFTLLELIVVIIIIGVLGTLGFTQYMRVVEKGRSAEAKDILGQIRKAQIGYNLENGAYTTYMTMLHAEAPTTTCTSTHYFIYSSTQTTGTATRCTASGKTPQGSVAYTVTIDYSTGTWGGSSGYY